jgi:hypothetical protein
MNKDKKWLKEEIVKLDIEVSENFPHYDLVGKEVVLDLINQLDELEVEQSDKKIRELESYNDELIRDNNQLRNALDNQGFLSQEWIDEHEQCITGHGADKNGISQYHHAPFVSVYDLQNLLVPKQDKQGVQENFYTFDNAKKWLQDNGFVVFEKDKLDEEVQRMVDEAYDATNEKTVIPQFVADYYNDYKNYELTFEEWFECSEFGKGGKTENKTFEWLLDNSYEVNIERQFILADIIAHGLNSYEVEKEKKYQVIIRDGEYVRLYLCKNNGNVMIGTNDNYIEKCPEVTYLTEQEIKAIDERYWAFAEEVKPCN